jgi:purine-binding chemotaxis protein CheW
VPNGGIEGRGAGGVALTGERRAAGEETMEQLDALSSQISFMRDGSQYLTFRLGEEEYGVEIEKVQEIKGYSAITPIPNLPAHVGGVMNLRGTIIPVMNLRAKLGMAEVACTAFTVIVVVSVGQRTMGLVVDAVSEVLNIPMADIQPAPDFGADVDAGFIRGMTKAGEKLVVVLDIDRVLGTEAASGLVAAPGIDDAGRDTSI